MVELLKQPQYQPMPVELQVLSIFAGNQGFLDDIPVNQVADWEKGMHEYFQDSKSDLLNQLKETGAISDELEKSLEGALSDYNATFSA